ncbi:hypothetical protein BDW62DRAFT_212104 [Aspergillus aurantiobrunneus]
MCTQFYRMYSCGCKKPEQFKQCDERLGTKVKCDPIKSEPLPESEHMCSRHMVKPGNLEMRRA